MAGFPGKEDTWDLAQGKKEGGRWAGGRIPSPRVAQPSGGTVVNNMERRPEQVSLSVTLLVLESQVPDHKGLTGTDWIWGLGGESNRRG